MINGVQCNRYSFIEAKVNLKSGIDARVSYQLSRESTRYEGNVIIERKDESISLPELLRYGTNSSKSIMTNLMLAAGKGCELIIYVEGDTPLAQQTALRLKSGIENEIEEKIVDFTVYDKMPEGERPRVQILDVEKESLKKV